MTFKPTDGSHRKNVAILAATAGVFIIGGSLPLRAAPDFLVDSPVELVPGIGLTKGLPAETALKAPGAFMTSGATPWNDHEKKRVADYLRKGGGLVLVHDAIAASGLIKGQPSIWAGEMPIFFTPQGRVSRITRGVSNFDVHDEMLYGWEVPENAKVLATTWTPNRKHLKGTDPQPHVYGVSPLIWTMEKDGGRIVCIVPGGQQETLRHPAIRVALARAMAWAAGLPETEADSLAKEADLAQLTYPPGGPLSPDQSLGTLEVHPDFKVESIASEPLVSKPLNIDWDGQGRLWVVESVEYPEGKQGGGPESMYDVWQRETELPKPSPVDRPAGDRISRLEDTDGDGVMDRKHVFADDLDLATSFCFYKDGVIVAQPPEILRLSDTDGDGKADKREVLYTGLGTADRHAVINNLRWGLDGWIYSTHGYASSPKVTSADGKRDFGAIGSGIVRFRADGSAIEMVSAKSGNCWGFEMTSDGELFFTQPTSGDLVMHVPATDRLMAEGGMGREPSWNVMVHMRPVKPLMSWEEIVENQPNDVIGSFTAACGCAIYEGGAWPDEWNMGYFTAEPTVHIVHHEKLTRNGVTYTAEKTREEEFSATRDFWSRPIDTRIGPDGQLYVIDFYNQAILHNDPRGPIHLWNNQAARPDRDHFFGRIHRYTHQKSTKLPKADLSNLDGLVQALSHPNREVRFRAQRLIEEGDVKAAAAKLPDASGVAKLHALWIRAAAGMLTDAEVVGALSGTDASASVTAARVVAAHPTLATRAVTQAAERLISTTTDARIRLQWLAALPASTVLAPEFLVASQAAADDRWTRAAIARLAKNNPGEVLAAALKSENIAAQAPLAALLFDAYASDGAVLPALLNALAGTEHLDLPLSSLAALRRKEIAGGTAVSAALEKLAADKRLPLAAAALPLAASLWNEDDRSRRLPALIDRLLDSGEADAATLSALATLPVFTEKLANILQTGMIRSPEVRAGVLAALAGNASPRASDFLLQAFPSLSATEKAAAIEILLGRPASAIALVDALENGSLPIAITGPQVLARLADHPDEKVRAHAAATVSRLRGAAEAKADLITRLLPAVSQPGDPAAGKQIYAACAVCHVFHGEGTSIGPTLEGMGVHGVESLLTHIIDPNREVEPSFHVWNITTTDQQTVSGFISRETADSVFIRHAGGEIEVPRDTIATKEDTGRSLMPEGFEGLGETGLRDLVTYIRAGEQRFHVLSFGKAATADGSRGVYLAPDVKGDRVGIAKYGMIEENGVPFTLVDPSVVAGGKNVIVLQGGMEAKAISRTMPREVEIPVNQKAARLHLLGAVAGWGFPAVSEKIPLLEIAVHYSDGSVQRIELVNGVDIADHVAGVDVPGSARTKLADHGQIRYLWRDLDKPEVPVSRLVLSSASASPAPMVAALTLESAGKDGTVRPPPAEGGAMKAP